LLKGTPYWVEAENKFHRALKMFFSKEGVRRATKGGKRETRRKRWQSNLATERAKKSSNPNVRTDW